MATFTGTTGNDTFTGTALRDVIKGLEGDDTLSGGAGNDYLDGGAGIDTLDGGDGDDIFIVDNEADVVTDSSGIDRVNAAVSYILAAGSGVENLTLTGAAINGTGNELNNIIIGNANANTLIGGGGNDKLDGGTGDDTMSGGTGNDVYVVDSVSDTITENAGEGIDRVNSSIDFSLVGFELENLTLTGSVALNGTGNAFDNSIVGNAIANTLTGGDGNDNMNGQNGDDTISGDIGNDILIGGNGNDILDGGVGNDILSGGTTGFYASGTSRAAGQIDTLTGGLGADTFVLGINAQMLNFYDDGDAATDGTADYALIMDFESGTDKIQLKGSSADYTLGSTTVGAGTGVYLINGGGPNELLALVQGTTPILASDFTFVPPPASPA